MSYCGSPFSLVSWRRRRRSRVELVHAVHILLDPIIPEAIGDGLAHLVRILLCCMRLERSAGCSAKDDMRQIGSAADAATRRATRAQVRTAAQQPRMCEAGRLLPRGPILALINTYKRMVLNSLCNCWIKPKHAAQRVLQKPRDALLIADSKDCGSTVCKSVAKYAYLSIPTLQVTEAKDMLITAYCRWHVAAARGAACTREALARRGQADTSDPASALTALSQQTNNSFPGTIVQQIMSMFKIDCDSRGSEMAACTRNAGAASKDI